MNKALLSVFIVLNLVQLEAASPDPEVQHLPAYEVKSTPLGFIGIRVKINPGLFGSGSESARIKEMVIQEIIPGSPAERAGLHPKDHLIRIDSHRVEEMTLGSLRQLLGSKEVGDLIVLEITTPPSHTGRTVELLLGRNKTK